MSSLIASPEQFIFAQNSELKTNSLKIAEAFNKLHKDVIRKIENIDCSKDFYERNFTPIQVDSDLGQNRTRKDKAYEMTRDGFIFVIMGFTGKKAAAIKESYINAFNLMHKKLFPPRNALVELPKFITQAQKGELYTLVSQLSRTHKKPRQYFWTQLQESFKLTGYKYLPFSEFEAGMVFIQSIDAELQAQALPNSAMNNIANLRALAGFAIPTSSIPEFNKYLDCLENQLNGVSPAIKKQAFGQRFIIRVCGDQTETMPVPDGAFVLTAEQIKNNLHEILPEHRLLDKETNAIFTVLRNQIIEQNQNKGVSV